MTHRILLVSDFFYPNLGGVENHIYNLAQVLLKNDCGGVRYLTNGLKVYYLYRLPFYLQTTLPTFFGIFPILRVICLREGITLVHAHQAFSTLGLESAMLAQTMGYKVKTHTS
eukprot:gene25718-11375_t